MGEVVRQQNDLLVQNEYNVLNFSEPTLTNYWPYVAITEIENIVKSQEFNR